MIKVFGFFLCLLIRSAIKKYTDSPFELIEGDKGYEGCPRVLSPWKESPAFEHKKELKQQFNSNINSSRAKIENCFGINK
jgi:hypothetical protein